MTKSNHFGFSALLMLIAAPVFSQYPTLPSAVVTALTNVITQNGGSGGTVLSFWQGRSDGITPLSTIGQLEAAPDAPPALSRLLRQNGVAQTLSVYSGLLQLYNDVSGSNNNPSPNAYPQLDPNVEIDLINLLIAHGGASTTISSFWLGRSDHLTPFSLVSQVCTVPDVPAVLCGLLLQQYQIPPSYNLFQGLTQLFNLALAGSPNPSLSQITFSTLGQVVYGLQSKIQTMSTTTTTTSSSPSVSLCGGQISVSGNATSNGSKIPFTAGLDLTDPSHPVSISTDSGPTYTWSVTGNGIISNATITGAVTALPATVSIPLNVSTGAYLVSGSATLTNGKACPTSVQVSVLGTQNCAEGTFQSGADPSHTISANVSNSQCATLAAGAISLPLVWDYIQDVAAPILNQFIQDLSTGARPPLGSSCPDCDGGVIPWDAGIPAAQTPILPSLTYLLASPASGAGSEANPIIPNSDGTLPWNGTPGYYKLPAGEFYISNPAFISVYNSNILGTPTLPMAGPLTPLQATKILAESNGTLGNYGNVASYQTAGIYLGSDGQLYEIDSAAQFSYLRSLAP